MYKPSNKTKQDYNTHFLSSSSTYSDQIFVYKLDKIYSIDPSFYPDLSVFGEKKDQIEYTLHDY